MMTDDHDPSTFGPSSSRNEPHLSEAWEIPDGVEIKRRLHLRRSVREDTLQHRRLHRHGGIVGGRNVVHLLYDRSVYGSHAQRAKLLPASAAAAAAAAASPGFCSNDAGRAGGGVGSSTRQKGAAVAAPPSPPSEQHQHSLQHPQPHPQHHQPQHQPQPQRQHQEARPRPRMPAPGNVTQELRTFGEYCSVVRYHSSYVKQLGGEDPVDPATRQRAASSKAVSTISIAFSPAHSHTQTMASTHGDHTVKITDVNSGFVLQTLEGHPRTPWTVKYHPIDDHIVASGCLGHQVRVWHWPSGQCLQMIRLEFAIISLSFHPTGSVLAIANGTRLHFWALKEMMTTVTATTRANSSNASNTNDDDAVASTLPRRAEAGQPLQQASQQQERQQGSQAHNSSNTNNVAPNAGPAPSRGMLTEVEQRHMLRCVHFPPNGNTIIVGGVNPNSSNSNSPSAAAAGGGGGGSRGGRGGISGGGMSFYLRLWDFDLQAALRPGETNNNNTRITGLRGGGPGGDDQYGQGMVPVGLRRRAISNVSFLCVWWRVGARITALVVVVSLGNISGRVVVVRLRISGPCVVFCVVNLSQTDSEQVISVPF